MKQGKKTKSKDALPKYVHLVNGRYVYRPYIPIAQRHHFTIDKYGYLAPPVKLGMAGDPLHRVYAAFAAAAQQLQQQREPDYLTINWLLTEYKKSTQYQKLNSETQKRHEKCEKILEHPIDINNKPSTLGQLPADKLKTNIVRRILDRRLEQYQANGKKGASQCNNEKALLSSMYRYGIQYIDQLAMLKNPCHGVEKFDVETRERYVTDDEYTIQYQYAQDSGLPYLPIAMELTYLLAARGVEITDLKVGSATDIGIIVKRRKGSKGTIVRWTPRLKAAWEAAISLHPQHDKNTYLLKVHRGGGKLTRDTLTTAWQRLKQEMDSAGLSSVYFWLHDLKRKGISDAADDRIAGHVSDTTRANYNVRLREYDPPR